MPEPFEKLNSLEERIKKAEQRIPELESQLKTASTSYAQAMDRNEQLLAMNKKYEDFEKALKSLIGWSGPILTQQQLDPSVSTGPPGTVEVRDPVRVIEVEDPQEPLHVNTTELRGQIAKLILEGRISTTLVNAKAVRAALIAEFGSSGEAWDIDSVLKELKALAAPPFRLFSFSPKNYMFRLRTGSEKRVKE